MSDSIACVRADLSEEDRMKCAAAKQEIASQRWLGRLPDGWTSKRLKYLSTINDETLPETVAPDYELLYVDIGSVDATEGIQKKEPMIFETAPSRARRIVRDGDTIVSTVRTYLRAVAPIRNPEDNLIVSTGFAVVRPKGMDPHYLAYSLRSSYFIETVVSRSVGVSYPATNPSEISCIELPVPPVEVQGVIARYLDVKTARIDELVVQKRELIGKLKEKRSALIARTVTSGLPPEVANAVGLEPNPEMRDSEVDWLGYIPAHWGVEKFAREVYIAEGQVDPEIEPYASMPLIAPNHIESGTGRLLALETAMDQSAESGKYLCLAGSVIYSKIRPALRKVVIAPVKCLCSADMYPLNCLKKLTNVYLYWLLLSHQFSAWSVLEADRVAMPKINRETLNELRLPVPPIVEQTKIAEYLAVETGKIDQFISKVEEATSRLTEYRQAVITSAITGKIDIRGLA